VDLALVLDASTSMLDPTRAGRSKLEAAKAAAGVLVDLLQFPGDQAAVITFNDSAVVIQQLTADRAALAIAFERVAVAMTTRLDLGVEAGQRELASTRHDPANLPVMIVLTDGRANPVGADVAVEQARAAKETGTIIYTIGVGTDLDREALREMASRDEWFYDTPDAEDLGNVYLAITAAFPCPATSYWGRR
jgi:Mg-chelatase subunit ChlD